VKRIERLGVELDRLRRLAVAQLEHDVRVLLRAVSGETLTRRRPEQNPQSFTTSVGTSARGCLPVR
jgi:hypothetical protein